MPDHPAADNTATEDVEEHVLLLAGGVLAAHALHLVAELGIADLFEAGARTIDDLAAALPAHSYPLQSILRLLSSHGFFTEISPGTFDLTAKGRLLRTDHPRSMRSIVRLYGFSSPAVMETEHSLRTGLPAFDKVFGESFFDYLQDRPKQALLFDDAMADVARYEGEAILSAYDFAPYRRVVDVGGGDATLLSGILTANAGASGVLFDQPHVTPRAEQTRDRAGLADRLDIVGGDFFIEVPAGGDLYVLKSVIHDWQPDRAAVILRACRQAMPARSRLVIFERMLAPGNASHTMANTLDLALVLLLNGRARTEADYAALFADSGLRLDKITAVGSGVYAIEAVPTAEATVE